MAPLLEPGMAIRCTPGSPAFAAPPPPLQRQLAAVGIAAADMPGGRRPPIAGFAVAAAAALQAAAREGHASDILQRRLEVRAAVASLAAGRPDRACKPTQVVPDSGALESVAAAWTSTWNHILENRQKGCRLCRHACVHIVPSFGFCTARTAGRVRLLGRIRSPCCAPCASMRDHAVGWGPDASGAARPWRAQAEEEWTDLVEEGGALGRLLEGSCWRAAC